MTSVRDAFFNRIYEKIKDGEDIYVLSADLGAPSLDELRKNYPERFINVGISEQNLVCVASGMALAGKKIVAYGLNPFPATRAFDQIRCLMAELKIPITLCALNAGLCSAECGYTHMPIEDVNLLRTLANIKIFNPTDETISIKLADTVGREPRFVRFDKTLGLKIYEDIELSVGFAISGNQSECKLGLITNGCYAKEINSFLIQENLYRDVKLIDLFKIPFDESKFIAQLTNCEKLITVEENALPGGLGSMVLEIMSDKNVSKSMKRYGFDVKNGYYNVFTNREYIRKDNSIDLESLKVIIRECLKEK